MWGEVYARGTTASYLLHFPLFANYVSICIPLRVPVRDFGNNVGGIQGNVAGLGNDVLLSGIQMLQHQLRIDVKVTLAVSSTTCGR